MAKLHTVKSCAVVKGNVIEGRDGTYDVIDAEKYGVGMPVALKVRKHGTDVDKWVELPWDSGVDLVVPDQQTALDLSL